MNNYLLELSVIHVALVLGYWFFLREEQQYAKMRFYLIGATLLALTIPLLKLPKLFGREPIAAVPLEAIPLDAITITPTADVSIWNHDAFIWGYIAISTFFLFKCLSNVLYLIHLEHQSSYEQQFSLWLFKLNSVELSNVKEQLFHGDEG